MDSFVAILLVIRSIASIPRTTESFGDKDYWEKDFGFDLLSKSIISAFFLADSNFWGSESRKDETFSLHKGRIEEIKTNYFKNIILEEGRQEEKKQEGFWSGGRVKRRRTNWGYISTDRINNMLYKDEAKCDTCRGLMVKMERTGLRRGGRVEGITKWDNVSTDKTNKLLRKMKQNVT